MVPRVAVSASGSHSGQVLVFADLSSSTFCARSQQSTPWTRMSAPRTAASPCIACPAPGQSKPRPDAAPSASQHATCPAAFCWHLFFVLVCVCVCVQVFFGFGLVVWGFEPLALVEAKWENFVEPPNHQSKPRFPSLFFFPR